MLLLQRFGQFIPSQSTSPHQRIPIPRPRRVGPDETVPFRVLSVSFSSPRSPVLPSRSFPVSRITSGPRLQRLSKRH